MNIHLFTLKRFCEKKYELHKSTIQRQRAFETLEGF